jgi:pilus assembly protein CpaC
MNRSTSRLADPRAWLIAVTVAGVAALLLPSRVLAANEKLDVPVGQSITHMLPGSVKTVSIANSNVADVVVAGPREVLINGKMIGMTTLIVWDKEDRSTPFDVVVRGQYSEQKIELSVQLAEINHTKAREYGMDILFQSDRRKDDVTAGTYGGDVATPSIPLSIFGGQPTEGSDIALSWTHGMEEVSTMLRALKSSGVIRVLAEPNVVAASGEKASFLSGGEIPVPVASSGSSGGSTVTIEWKEFGVKVEFVPTIVDEGVINLKVAPEVSSLDFGNGIDISGFRIPALRSRKATTTVELRNEEILVIGGLIMEEETEYESKIPVLGDIPLLGYLFRSTQKATNVSELMLVVTPRIVRALPPGTKVPLPTDRTDVGMSRMGDSN